ncbi:MAG: DUF1456 family protein [Pseudomonadaceae bacterium]|nr:DUF1456 family protein [Pseudomonadaceae bacterium]
MKPNDCLRRLRYTLDFDDNAMVAVFAGSGRTIERSQMTAWLKQDDHPSFEACSDESLAAFLNGLIVFKRGKREGAEPEIETRLNNNMVFRKLKIAFNLQAEDILEILSSEAVHISKHELSAFFRRPDHKHYRDCKDQILRNFLMGLQVRHRGRAEPD